MLQNRILDVIMEMRKKNINLGKFSATVIDKSMANQKAEEIRNDNVRGIQTQRAVWNKKARTKLLLIEKVA